MVKLTPSVTPGRVQVPHLESTFDPITGTYSFQNSNTNPFNYSPIAESSQAYTNIYSGIPSDYNQYSGCPEGYIMGVDGVCRLDPNFIGAGQVTTPEVPDIDIEQPEVPEVFQPSNVYQQTQQTPAQIGPSPAEELQVSNISGQNYSTLPGGFNNWSDEAHYDYGLDKGYFSQLGVPNVAGETPQKEYPQLGGLGFLVQKASDVFRKKSFEDWAKGAIERGYIKATEVKGPTGKPVTQYTLLKKRGPNTFEFGGGQLEPIEDAISTPEITAENTWKTLLGDRVIETPLYSERIETIPQTADPSLAILQTKDQIELEEERQRQFDKTGYYTDRFGKTYGPGANIAQARFEGLNYIDELKKNLENLQQESKLGFIQQDQVFDPYLGKYVPKSAGLEAEKRRRERSVKLLGLPVTEKKEAPKQELKKANLMIGTLEGNKVNNMSIANQGSYIGSSVYKNPTGGHYQQDGKFVTSDGTTVAFGSMSDSIYAMLNGTAVDSVLNRTFRTEGSTKVMKQEAKKMLDQGKITKQDYNTVASYNSKKDYQNKPQNKTIYENGNVVGGGGTGQSLGPVGSGLAGTSGGSQNAGNTGSGSKKDKIICTEMYRQTQLKDWSDAMMLWYIFQKKYLTHTHQVGYHFLFKPFVNGMKKSKVLTFIGAHFAKERTKDIKHIMFNTKFSLLGRVYRLIFEPLCYLAGLILTKKEKKIWQ